MRGKGVKNDYMIDIRNLNKTFNTSKGKVEVLKNINLKVEKGDIFGIIGFSGAGKSTMIRCLNRLEEPTSGSIFIGNNDIVAMNKAELREARKKIGMIFQDFNLFDSMNVYKNVAFPLKIAGYSEEKIKNRVHEILNLVELSDKVDFYPAQLSGGQKQRVGIARALANEPDVLLSDEATSALDPQTTYSILELLRDINKKLNLTILLITHELDVIKYICNNMAVIEDGSIVETGSTNSVFLNPKSNTAKKFVKIMGNLSINSECAGGEVI